MLLIACVSLLLSAGVPAAKAAVAKPASSTATLKPVGDGKVAVFAVGDVVRTSVDNANVRGDPSTDKKPVATLPFGTQVRVVEAAKTLSSIGKLTQRWYRVETIDQAKAATGWLFGNTLTTLGSTTWSVSFTTEGPAVVRFFRADRTPKIASADVADVADSTLQAIAGPSVLGHASVVLRGCDPDCFDVLVVERGDGAVIMGTGKPKPNAPLSADGVVVGREHITFHGTANSLEVLLRPQASYTDAELVERFLRNCNDVVRVTAPGMFDEDVVLPQCEVRPFEQNCSPDICWDAQEGCLEGCGKTCNGCDATCGGTCGTCMNRCTDDICRRQCAKARVACFNGCVNTAQSCRSGGCAGVYETCSTAKAARIDTECGGRAACAAASTCIAAGGKNCPKQSAWCTESCYEQ
jgi:hypothetical protein